jgi:hypothetical protein
MEARVGEDSMLYRLMTAVLIGAFGLASLPALALDLPDSGWKNFSPGNDTPTHFANESVPVSARTADTTASDFSAEEAAAPVPSVARPAASAHPNTARHGKSVSARKSAKHTSGKSRGNNSALVYHSPAQARAAGKASVEKSVRAAGARSGSKRMTPGATKSATAKHGKAGARHARVAVTHAKEA